ncbi:MAG: universal stress protein [Flavobacteriales bacterium]|nr:universal stress protein [Flavobacteriales bacterium]
MKKILLPVDFSDCTDSSVEMALEIARKHNTEVEIFHVIESQVFANTALSSGHDLSKMIDNLQTKAQSKLKDLTKRFDKHKIKAEYNLEVKGLFTPPYEHILKRSLEGLFSFIIMGTSGTVNEFEQVFMGSNAQKVVRRTKLPVVITKPNIKTQINRVVYTSDFVDQDLNLNIEKHIHFGEPFNCENHLLFVNTPTSFETTATIEQRLENVTSRFDQVKFRTHIYNDFSPAEGVFQFVDKWKIDMLSISTHGKTGINRFFNTNLTETLVNNLNIPILVFNK